MSLLVVGTGRCGTLWLSKVLATDKRWHVEHETWGYESRLMNRHQVQEIIGQPWRCEVSQYLTEAAHRFRGRKAVVLRNPLDVFWSFAAREEDSRRRWENRIEGIYYAMDQLIEEDAMPIWFELMVHDTRYLTALTSRLGFQIDLANVEWEKVNATSMNDRRTTPKEWRGLIESVATPLWRKWREMDGMPED